MKSDLANFEAILWKSELYMQADAQHFSLGMSPDKQRGQQNTHTGAYDAC